MVISTEAVETFGQKVVEKFQPDGIILFGSYAYGELLIRQVMRQDMPDTERADLLLIETAQSLREHFAGICASAAEAINSSQRFFAAEDSGTEVCSIVSANTLF